MKPSTRKSAEATRLDNAQAEAQLELKDRALAASAEGITIADTSLPDNPLIYVNAGFERLTGYSAADVIGRNCRFLQGPGTDLDTVETLRNAIREKRAVTVQLLNYRKDGTPFWNRLSITPVQDASEKVTHFIGIQSDVTAEVEARDALEKANELLEAADRAMKRDLQAAAAVQRSLLPDKFPESPNLTFAYQFRPCKDVGGDSLNVLALDERHVGISILDVSGHGVAASLLSVTLSHMLSLVPERSFLYQAAEGDSRTYTIAPPAKVVARLNRHFVINASVPQFFTMIYGILAKETGEFQFVAAGHLGPVHVPANAAPRVLETGGIPVGLMASATYEEHSVTLAPGDRLYFCTDGVPEAEDTYEQDYGVERLIHALHQNRHLALSDSLVSVMREVVDWSAPAGPADDASMLAIERR